MSAHPNHNLPTLPDLIRRETDDGLLAVRFLVDLMDARIEGAKITDRLAAARELLDRGFGKPPTVTTAAAAATASGDDSDAEREATAKAMLAERIRRVLDAPQTPIGSIPENPENDHA